jgi:hypothetical protein
MSDLQSRQKEIDLAIRHNENEMVEISESLARIGSLESTPLNIADVYGDRADLPELKKHVERWAAHKENQAVVRVAQIPQGATSSTA